MHARHALPLVFPPQLFQLGLVIIRMHNSNYPGITAMPGMRAEHCVNWKTPLKAVSEDHIAPSVNSTIVLLSQTI